MAQILRLRRTDAHNEHVLLRISQEGQKSLDLKLIGTDHAQLFHASLKESSVNNLQTSHFTGDLEEWKTVLRHVLLHEWPETGLPEKLQGLETVAAISGSKLTVTIRQNIGGITQRLGSIRLDEDTEREEVSGFEWADTAVANADALRSELEALQASVSSQKDNVVKLNQQLDDLVKAKKEHEDDLLQKFTALLNAKKLKIRDQQRLLNGAQIDAAAAHAVSDSRDSTGRRATGSRKGKRRANDIPVEAEADDVDEEEDGFEPVAPSEETPPASDRETEDEGDLDQAPAPHASTQRNLPPIKQKEPSSMDVDEPETLPPRRELPFSRSTRQTSKQPEPQPPAITEADDDDETDDEL